MSDYSVSQSNATEPSEAVSTQGNGTSDQRRLERLAREIKEITALYNIGVAVGSSLDLKQVIWGLYKESSRLVNTSNFALTIYDEETDTINYVLVYDQGEKMPSLSVKLATHQGLTERVMTQQSPILIHNLVEARKSGGVHEINRFRPDKQIYSWLGVPILNPAFRGEKAQGVIAMWSYTPHAFTEHDLWLLSAIGTQAAIAIRNARLYESTQRRAAEMALLNDVARTLSSTLSLEQVLTLIMEQVEGTLNVEAGSLLLTDPASGDLVFQIALGEKAKQIKPFRVPKGQGIAGEVALIGKPLLVADVTEDKRHFKKFDQDFDFQTRNVLCVPMVLYDNIIGVLQVINKKDGNFTQSDLELLSSIASYAAIAIQNARLHQNVLAERDRVIEAEEQARRRLARDLHDGPTQLVAGIMMSLDFSRKAIEKDPSLLPKELNYMQELAGRASHQMRTMLFELRPLVLETQGLAPALEVFLERRQKDIETGTKLELRLKPSYPAREISRLDERVEATIFAIVQETVNNALKHAQANHILVELRETHAALIVTIADNGQGFNVDKVMNNYEQRGSLGMINIRERTELIGGELTVTSESGKGTRVVVSVPKAKADRLKKRGGTGQLDLPPDLLPPQ
ncbi:MAG: GAF domain-containing protein [Chloroflexota bacterium]